MLWPAKGMANAGLAAATRRIRAASNLVDECSLGWEALFTSSALSLAPGVRCTLDLPQNRTHTRTIAATTARTSSVPKMLLAGLVLLGAPAPAATLSLGSV